MPPLRLAALPLAVLFAACAAPGGFVCPARGGRPWIEATSDHFVVRTDAGERKAAEIADELEALQEAIAQALFGAEVPMPARVEVVVFARGEDLLPFTRDPRVGGLMHEDAFGERRILLAADGGDQASRLVAHELVHLLAFHRIPRQPLWFAEGMAGFFEGAGERRLGGGRTVGSPPGDDVAFLAVAAKPPFRDVVEWQTARWPLEHLYAKSFLVFHFLYGQHRTRLRDLEGRLVALESPRDAWNAVFPEWNVDDERAAARFDEAVVAHAGRYLRRTAFAAPPADARSALRHMEPGEVHGMRLGLPHRWGTAVVRAEVDEALAEDAGNVQALERQAQDQPTRAEALARRAVAAHPEDPRAWELLAQALRGEAAAAGREAALRRAIDVAPARVRARVMLAAELAGQGRYADAQAASAQALEVAPWSPVALAVASESLARTGRCREAREAAQRAREVLAGRSGRSSLAETLSQVEGFCRAAGAAGAGGR